MQLHIKLIEISLAEGMAVEIFQQQAGPALATAFSRKMKLREV